MLGLTKTQSLLASSRSIRFSIGEVSVVDDLHAVSDGKFHGVRAARMGAHSPAMGACTTSAAAATSASLITVASDGAWRNERIAGDHELDDIDPFANQFASEPAILLGPVGDDGHRLDVRHVELAHVAESSGDGQPGTGGQEPWPGDFTGIDGIANDDVEAGFRGGRADATGDPTVEIEPRVAGRDKRVLLGRNHADRFQVFGIVEAQMCV